MEDNTKVTKDKEGIFASVVQVNPEVNDPQEPTTPEPTQWEKASATRKRNNKARKDAQAAQKNGKVDKPTGTPAKVGFVAGAEAKSGSKVLDIKDILTLNMQDLVNYAESMGLDTYTKSRQDMLVELGVTYRRGGKIYVRPQPSVEKSRYLNENNFAVPANTIFPEDEFDDWLKIVEEHPMAFNGADLSDKSGEIVHTLHAENKCACGAKVNFPDHPDTGRPVPVMMCTGVAGKIKRKGRLIDVLKCIHEDSFRKFIFHELPKGE